MLESAVEEFLGRRVKAEGGKYLKFTSPGNSGVPDRIVILRGMVVFVELKQDTGTLSKVQRTQIKSMTAQGAKVHVVYGKKGATLFMDWLKSHAYERWGKADMMEWGKGKANGEAGDAE